MEHWATRGFSELDWFMVQYCPLFSVLGSIVHILVIYLHLNSRSVIMPRLTVKWCVSRMIVGYVLGLVYALSLTGALVNSPTIVARLIGFSIITGFVAPKLWNDRIQSG